MADIDHPATDNPHRGAAALEQLAESARGWHRIQLAVLGFIGFCGVFWDGGSSGAPGAVRWLGAALVAVAFVLANVAIFLVGRVAHPFHDPTDPAGGASGTIIVSRAHRLRTGIRLTYLALALLVAATLSSWMPAASDDDAVASAGATGALAVADERGRSWCSHLVESRPDGIVVHATEGRIAIPQDGGLLVRWQRGC